MAMRLRLDTITAVALCPLGANLDEETGDGAHVTLFKTREARPMPQHPTTANAASVVFVNKARALYPHEPIDKAILRLAHDRPDEYGHASGQITKGTADRFTPPRASPAPGLSQAAATAAIGRKAALVMAAGIPATDAWPLVAKMFPSLYAVHARRPSLVAKSAPTTESLVAELAAYFAEVQGGLRRVADQRAAELTVTERLSLVAQLLTTAA